MIDPSVNIIVEAVLSIISCLIKNMFTQKIKYKIWKY